MKSYFKAAVLRDINKPIEILNLAFPKLEKGQVLIKMIYSGICRSQIMEITGGRGVDKWLPHLLGHEGYGEVIDKGFGVSKFKTGDKVVVSWIPGMGLDSPSPKFISDNGEKINSGTCTTFNEFSIVSENKLHHSPKNLPEKILPLFGCAFLTGGGMVINTFKNLIQPGKINVLLIGFGGVGSAAALALTKYEFCTVYLLESSPQKREVAEKFKFKKIFETIQDIDSFFETCDFKFDYCFETAGHVETIEFGFRSISNKGKLIFASHPVSGELLKLDPFEFIKGKQIAGTWGGNEDPAEIIIEISNILSRNLHLVDLFIGEIYTLEEINLAIESLSLGVNMKPILSLRSE